MDEIIDVDYNTDGSVTRTYKSGKKVTIYADGTSKESGGGTSGTSGWLSGALAAIPGILSALFPSGVGGGGSTPTVYTDPTNGNTNVNLGGNSNNLLMFALVGMVAYLIFTGQKPIKAK